VLGAEVADSEEEEEIACCWIEERKKGREEKVDGKGEQVFPF